VKKLYTVTPFVDALLVQYRFVGVPMLLHVPVQVHPKLDDVGMEKSDGNTI
jgi:hypothetical protein